jgi:Domain of unknown function (DUF4157)
MAMGLFQKRSDISAPQTSAPSQTYSRPFVVPTPMQEESVQASPEPGVSLLNNRYQVSATSNYQPGWIARAQAASQPRAVGVQAKLTIGQPNDKYEQEADRVAEQVMGMSEEKVQGAAAAGDEEEELQAKPMVSKIQREVLPEEEEGIQAKRSSGRFESRGDFESRLSGSKSGGSPLPEDVRSFMEPRFGADFSGVRVHTGSEAVQMNQEVGAQAFAPGQDVYFGAGKGPGKDALTAHELTHVVQQTSQSPHTAPLQRTPSRVASSSSPPPGNLASQIKKFSAKLTHAGSTHVTTAKREGDFVNLTAPGVSYVGSASLATGIHLGPDPIQVGIIQTVVSSERVGVYRGEGASAAEGATEQRISLRNVPDAKRGSIPPFYEAPEELTDQKRTVSIVADDEPKHQLPVSYGSGSLIAVKGSDRFMSSLAAKRGNELLHLKNFSWEAPWSLVLNSNQDGFGGTVNPQNDTMSSPNVPGGLPINKVGNDPSNIIQAYTSPVAADAALKADRMGFLKDLSRHKAKAPDSYELMIGALSRSSMKLGIKVVVDSTNSRFGKDKINVTASCSSAQTKLVELNDHESATIQHQANDVCDLKYLSEATIVNLWINEKMVQWKFPFNSGEATMTNGDRGRYKIEYFLL